MLTVFFTNKRTYSSWQLRLEAGKGRCISIAIPVKQWPWIWFVILSYLGINPITSSFHSSILSSGLKWYLIHAAGSTPTSNYLIHAAGKHVTKTLILVLSRHLCQIWFSNQKDSSF